MTKIRNPIGINNNLTMNWVSTPEKSRGLREPETPTSPAALIESVLKVSKMTTLHLPEIKKINASKYSLKTLKMARNLQKR